MNELNISKCIIQKRKEKGITQEELAEYIGVSKAAVSKWESGQSYPDISLLPELAAFFNVSVDELLGYSPQLSREEIKTIYNHLSREFAVKPLEEVMEKCNELIRKYYSCFPFLLAMMQLFLNHVAFAKTEEAKKEILRQCIILSRRVKEESEDVSEIKSANSMEALAEMALGNSEGVIRLLDNKLTPYSGDDVMLIMAYQMQGKDDEAKKVNQILLYQNVINTLTLLNNYLALHMTDPVLFEQIYAQAKQLIDAFKMREILTNAVFGVHITAAQGYVMQQEKEKALKALEQYADIVCGYEYPLKLKGNEYFDQVDTWLEDSITIGTSTPLDDTTTRANLIKSVEENPAFTPLREDEQYKRILRRLKRKLGQG